MRKTVVLVLAAILMFAVVAPALAEDACACTPWCGKTRSMGYWKNDGVSANNYWMTTSWTFAPPNGDYKQIFMNQAIAFHNNYMRNACCNGVAFRDTYYKGSCGSMKSMYEIDAMVHAIIDADFDGFSRAEVLMLKDAMDDINNGYNIYTCTAPTNGS